MFLWVLVLGCHPGGVISMEETPVGEAPGVETPDVDTWLGGDGVDTGDTWMGGDRPDPTQEVPIFEPACTDILASGGAAAAWCQGGEAFAWDGAGWPVEIFFRCDGEPSATAIYAQHGWPSSSFDFEEIFQRLSEDYYICALDTPGYGFSGKPSGYAYSILDDAALVDHFLVDVMGVSEVVLLTHDKGDSVGLELLHRTQQAALMGTPRPYQITQHILLNGSIHLEQAELSVFQMALWNANTGPALADRLSGAEVAAAMGGSVYSPPMAETLENEWAAVYDYGDGTDVMDETIQYLTERETMEDTPWLDALGKSEIATTLIWGEQDPVAVTDVADHVWDEVLAQGTAPAEYWRLPCANHYVQEDRPQDVVEIVRHAITGSPVQLAAGDGCGAGYLYRSR